MDLAPRPSPLRCPYCHGPLGADPVLRCARCATPAHLGCVIEHGGCPILACEPLPAPALEDSWEAFVQDAQPWLEVGSSLQALNAWEAVSSFLLEPDDDDDQSLSGSGSSSRAA